MCLNKKEEFLSFMLGFMICHKLRFLDFRNQFYCFVILFWIGNSANVIMIVQDVYDATKKGRISKQYR